MAERSTRSVSLRLRPSEHRTLLLIGDLAASALAVGGALFSWLGYSWIGYISRDIKPMTGWVIITTNIHVPFWFYLLPLIWLMLLVELYEAHTASNPRRTRRGIAIAAFVGLVLYALVFIFIRDPQELPRIGVGAYLVLASLLTLGWRSIYIQLYTSSGFMRRILVIGAGKAGRTLARIYQKMDPPPFQLVGFIDDDRDKLGKDFEGFPVYGNSEHMLQVIEEQHISDVVIGIMGVMRGITFQRILDAQEEGMEIIPMPTLYEEMTGRVPIHHLESDWIVRSFVDQARVSGFYELFKRFMDILGGLAGMALFFIVFPFAALAIIIDSGRPIFYSQSRFGKGGSLFMIRKFRTMYKNAEADGKARLASENDPRVTRVGNFLRKTRLDELPQFWNVLHGEISLVGPRAERPELVAEFQRQIPFYRARLLVKPGLTGWAQINYGYVATITETSVKLEYDLFYIKHRTLMMDIQIVLRTIGTVARRGGEVNMKVLVTGGAGFIGSHIVRALLERGDRVRVLDNFSTGKRENLAGLDVEIIEADLRDASRVTEACRGIETVFHEAAFVSVPQSMKEPRECFDVNVTGTATLLQAAHKYGVRRVVFATSAAVYGDSDAWPLSEETPLRPLSPYAASKCVDEIYGLLYTTSFGLEVAGLRYFNVYGPRQRPDSQYAAAVPIFIRRLMDAKPISIFGDGGQTRDLIYVGDVVRANLVAAGHPSAPGQVFNICTGQETRIIDLVEILQDLFPSAPAPGFSEPRAGDIYRSIGSPQKAANLLNFRAEISLAEGLKQTVEWMKNT